MDTFARLSISALLLLSVACTDEAGQGNRPLPEGEDGQRREVLLTLKNKLAVPHGGTKAAEEAGATAGTAGSGVATKADTPIATAEENYIRSLDVYVFGSETEGGGYTFQELFYYRDNAAVVPGDWAHGINLTATTGSDNATTALMKLTKGLYVKIYCVANREQLYRTEANGAITPYLDFQPLAQSAPGQAGNTVRAGVPTETDFLALHTQRMNPATATPTEDDILVTPLPMAGAYTTALDLTDFSVSARTQVGFKLTRTMSRFDVQNDAKQSKFTITGISMAQARPGASFFPIRVLGTLPTAVDGELITTPTRPFTGVNANKGLQTGAFYSYASPTEDAGYLILKGTYAVNQSENQEVSYQIPFKPANDAEGGFLEITHNHRYTIAITKADAFRLDFTMTVADWADDGSIDDYNPGGDNTSTTAEIDLTPDPTRQVKYDETTRQITMPIISTAKFDLTATTGYTLTKTYTGGPAAQQYDWLEVSAPADVTKAATAQKYTFTLKSGYTETEYPEAVVKVKNENNGDTQLFKVSPALAPPVITSDAAYTLAAEANTNIPFIEISVNSIGGSTISGPEWLTYDKVSADAAVTTYRVSLNPNKTGITFPEDLPAGQTITFANKKDATLTTNVTVSFTDAVRGDASLLGYDAIEKEADNSDSYRVAATGKTISVAAYSMFKNPNMTIATAYDSQYGTNNKNWLPVPVTVSTTEIASNRRKYTYEIVIPASSGTDAAYLLHKGTVTVKDGSTEVKTYTVWRGASNKPYPTGDSANPYYTAIKKGDNWWAPVNCGAKRIAKNGKTDTVDGIGNIYQWGRKDATNYGSPVVQGPLSSGSPVVGTFYKNSSSPYDWLSPQNPDLWQNGLNNPCPDGYRVPTITELNTWVSGTFGGELLKITTDAGYPDLVLPAAGGRNYNDGSEDVRGTFGCYWSSSVSGTIAYYVDFNSATVNTGNNGRAYGRSVRCVRK